MSAGVDDQLSGLAAGMRGIRGDHTAGDLRAGQQFPQHRDLAGLRADSDLGDDHTGGLADPGQQMWQVPGGAAGAAQGLPVERDHRSAADRLRAQPHPCTQRRVEGVGVEQLQYAADRFLTRCPA